MKKAILIFTMLLFCASFSIGYQITKKELTVQVNENGAGLFNEKYFLKFSDKQDSSSFDIAWKDNGNQWSKWATFDPEITPHFGNIETNYLTGVNYDNKNKILEFNYTIDNPVSKVSSEDSRAILWIANSSILFQNLGYGTVIAIPEKTTLTIILPANAELKTKDLPPAIQTAKNILTLTKSTNSSNFSIQYTIPKPIAQITVFSEFFDWLKLTGLIYAIIAMLIALGIVGIVKRKEIVDKMENYIVSHSEISRKEEFEEIDIED